MRHIVEYKNKKLKGVEHLNVRYLNGKSKQLLAWVLGGSLVFGMTGAGAYAAGMRNGEGFGPQVTLTETAQTEEKAGAGQTEAGGSVEETVYVLAGADGTAQKIIVSDLMKHTGGEDTYTQETLQKELPVEMAVSFKLDGKPVAAKDIAGKSGKVTMRFDYTNKQYRDVEIGGETKRVYVPFVMMTGMMLDNERFSDVEVSNGRVINDGDRTIVAGFAMPGLQESLELDKEKLELPEYIEVTANVKDFRLETTMTLATTEVFADLDMDETGTFDELDESMEELTDAMDQLMDGSSALYDGLSELLDKSGDLTDGIGKLHSGAEALAEGAGSLESGAGDLQTGAGQVKSGVGSLKSGAGDLKAGADALQTGAGTVKTGAGDLKAGAESLKTGAGNLQAGIGDLKTGAETLQAGIGAVDAGAGNLQAGAAELDAGLGSLAAQSDNLRAGADQIFTALLNTANAQLQASGAGVTLTRENYGQVLDSLGLTNLKAQLDSCNGFCQGLSAYTAGVDSARDGAARLAEGVNDLAAGTGRLAAGADQLVDGAGQLAAGAGELADGAARLETGAGRLEGGAGELESGAGQLAGGAGQLVDGAGRLESGAGQLESGAGRLAGGAGELAGGAGSLYEGIGTLQTGSSALIDGVEQLKDGAMQLSEGIEKFNEEGIQALVDAFDGDLKGLKDRMTAVTDAAKNYKSFKDGTANRGESVRFIYKTEKIGDE